MTRRILVADDSKTIQTVIDFTFRATEFEVHATDNAEDAIAWLEADQADVILADVDMPQMDGYKLCDLIRSNAKTANVPVLLLGGAFEAVDERRAAAVGASGHIKKPFDSKELIDHVSQLCGMEAGSEAPLTFAEKLAAQEDQQEDPTPVDLSDAREISSDAASLEPLATTDPDDPDNNGAALGKMRLKRVATLAPAQQIGAVDPASRVVQGDDHSWAPPPVDGVAESEDVVFADAIEVDAADDDVVDADTIEEADAINSEDISVSDDFEFDAPIDFEEPLDQEAAEEIAVEAAEEIAVEAGDLDIDNEAVEFAADDLLEDDSAFQISEDLPISEDVEDDLEDDLEEAFELEDAMPEEELAASGEAGEEEAVSEAQEPDLPNFGAPVSEIMAAAAADDLAEEEHQGEDLLEDIDFEQEELEAIEADVEDLDGDEDDLLNSAGPSLEPPPSPDAMAASAAADVDVWSLAEPADEEAFSDSPVPAQADEEWQSDVAPAPLTDVPTEIGDASAPPIAASFNDAPSVDSGVVSPFRQAMSRDPSAVLHATAVVEDAVAMVTERGVESLSADSAGGLNQVPSLPKEELVALAREAIEKVAWEVVPELAETIIRSELSRLLEEQASLAEESMMSHVPLPRHNTPPPPPPADEGDYEH